MSLTPGATLGPYTIRAELGHGGMGVVYTALDPRLDRQVAIKVLPPDLTRPHQVARGWAEALPYRRNRYWNFKKNARFVCSNRFGS